MTTAVYPTIADYDAFVRSLTPAPSMIGDSDAFMQVMAGPWAKMENDLQTLVVGLVDLDAAPGWVLDVAGARVNEGVGGLGTTEYRRIIAGKRAAIASTGTPVDVYAVGLALAGSGVGRIWTLTNTTTGLSSVHLSLLAPFDATAGYLIRAGQVLRSALPIDAEATAALYTVGDGLFDVSRFDTVAFADTIPIP